MEHLCRANLPRFYWHQQLAHLPARIRIGQLWGLIFQLRYSLLFLAIVGLLCCCNSSQPSEMQQTQANNLQLTKNLHAHLNHRDWHALEGLCAERVRYRGRSTHFTEVEESKAQFTARYRTTLANKSPSSLEIRQLYPAGEYHVIAEGLVAGQPPDTTLPVCLIYTIENQHITRLYVY